ncbi:MAG TPA: trypsin-like peptidase domain-containing protein [Planctomycetota bacterium]|nr:trypsin-like peptidase domain-containing protein [Planctomycetota bacterium]
MAHVKCKCGADLEIADGASEVTCPSCNHTYRVRVATGQMPVAPIVVQAPAAMPPPLPQRPPVATAPRPSGAVPARPTTAIPPRAPSGATPRPVQAQARPIAPARPPTKPVPIQPASPPSAVVCTVSGSVSWVQSPATVIDQSSVAGLPPAVEAAPAVEDDAVPMPFTPPEVQAGAEAAEAAPAESEVAEGAVDAQAADDEIVVPAETGAEQADAAATAGRLEAGAQRVRSAVVRGVRGPVRRAAGAPVAADGAEATGVKAPSKPSRARVYVMIAGAVLGLAGLVLVAIAPSTTSNNSGLLTSKKKELRDKLKQAQDAVTAESLAQTDLKKKMTDEQKKTSDLKYESEMIDHRFAAASSNSALSAIKRAQDDAEDERAIREGRDVGNAMTRLMAAVEKSVVVIHTDKGLGSGFIVEPGGTVVTNYHVVAGANRVTIQMQTRNSTEMTEIRGAKVVAAAPELDLALIQLGKAPDDIGVEGNWPAVEIRRRPGAVGESVFAIGSPGTRDGGALDYTITTGIISADRSQNGASMLQMTVPVNPGNSGGPLFDSKGSVVGVVSAKLLDAQAVSFAVPAETLRYFMDKRAEDGTAVADLPNWEKEHNPKVSLESASRELFEKYGTPLTDECSQILPTPDGRALYFVYAKPGKIQEYLIGERRLGRMFQAGFLINGAVTRGSTGQIVALSSTKKKLLMINTATMQLEKESALRSEARFLTYAGGPGDAVILATPSQRDGITDAVWVDKGDDVAGFAGVEMPKPLLPFSAASNAKYAAFVTLDENSLTLRVYPTPAFMKLFADWSAFRRKNANLTEEQLQAKLDELSKKLEAIEKKYDLGGPGEEFGFGDPIIFSGERLLVGRHAYKFGEKVEQDTEFEANPLRTDDKISDEAKLVYARADMLQAASADGRVAASQAHVYSAAGKIIAKLPFIASQPVFSKDGRVLFALDSSHAALFRFSDWEKAFAVPAGKK